MQPAETGVTHRVIMTVGTSLVTNDGGDGGGCTGSLNTLCRTLYDHAVDGNACLAEECEAIVDELALLPPENTLQCRLQPIAGWEDRLPQELSYLYLLLANQLPGATVDVFLLASHTRLGEACAQVIVAYIKKLANCEPWNRVQCVSYETVPGFVEDNPRDFVDTGAPTLVRRIISLADKAPDDCAVIVNPTGGFKEAVPYATIATALIGRQWEMHYLFLTAKQITVLPRYPIGLDFPLYHREANMLRGVEQWDGYRVHLSDRMANLALADAKQQPDLRAVFEGAYERQRDTDPFQEYSKSVVGRLVRNQDYRRRLVDLIEQRGATIWLGDKITMAAGHADHHHHDLLEIAELIIPPLGDGFLNEEEEFVLVAAVLLHDCGHALGALPRKDGKPVELFPSEVRDLHHFLTFHRLTNDGHAKAIGWDPEAELANEVARACRYHRKSTGWDKPLRTLGKTICPFIDTEIVPPAQAVSEYNLNCKVDLPKLVALLRLIDGCDNQSRRVGPAARVDTLEQLFGAEKEVHAQTFGAMREAALSYAGRHQCLPGVDILRAWRVDGSEPVAGVTRNEEWWRMRVLLATNDDIDPVWRHLWTETARALDEVAVRDRQYIHFLKHQVVRSIVVRPVFDNGYCVSFDIELVPDEDPKLLACLDNEDLAKQYCKEMNGANTLRDWILTDMEGEMCQAAKKYIADKRSPHGFDVRPRW